MKIIMQNTVSIWKLYSIACWDDDKYQKASAKHEKIAHRFISLRLFFPPYLCPPFSHILCWINIILKSILPLHSSTEGKKSFANIYNILSHSQHNTILLSIFFFWKCKQVFFIPSRWCCCCCYLQYILNPLAPVLFIWHLFDY